MSIFPLALWSAFGGLGFSDLLFILPFFGITIGGTGLWIAMLVDCVTKEADTGKNKVAWILGIALTHCIGAAVYLLVRRPQRIAELGR